jgi:hypothetical protein
MAVQNNDPPTTPTNRTSTGADDNGNNVASDVDITSLTASTDGLSPSVRQFELYDDHEQLDGDRLKLAYRQVSSRGPERGAHINRVNSGFVGAEVVHPLIADILWPDMEWQEHLFAMRRRKISDPHVCIATYIRNNLLHAPRPSEYNVACGGCFERRNACTCFEACSFCIDARRPCARFFIDDKDHKHVTVLAGLPDKSLSLARGLPYMRFNKGIKEKGYFVQGL